MIKVAGVDVGAGTVKVVILGDNDLIISDSVMPVEANIVKAVDKVMHDALKKAGISLKSLDNVVSTGSGRSSVPFAKLSKTEIICHGRGAYFLVPKVRTIIDIGAQDSKIITVNEKGSINNFVMNDKCAAGTGRFIEVMAKALGLDIDKMGSISLNSKHPCPITSTCTVFAESEVVALRAEGRVVEDLAAGIFKAIATRISLMGAGIGFNKEIVFTGGVAKNIGVKKALEDVINVDIIKPAKPQITGALGAALIARDQVLGA
jgi:predicted CoA-substrate-specific enzyme activase